MYNVNRCMGFYIIYTHPLTEGRKIETQQWQPIDFSFWLAVDRISHCKR
jgi:hypothetical protein